MRDRHPANIRRKAGEQPFVTKVKSAGENIPDRRAYPLQIRRIDAKTAHSEKVVSYEQRRNRKSGKDDVFAILRWPETGHEKIEVSPDRQHILTYATFKDLDSALSDLANSPVLPSGRTLRQEFEEERDRMLEMTRQAHGSGKVEPDYGTYAWDPLEERLYLVAPEFWHRLALRVSNGMIHRDPERKMCWAEIDQRLNDFVVGIVGLSVGGNILEGWMRDSAWAKHWKGADYDYVELKNLTRLARSSMRYVVGSRSARPDQTNPFDLPRPITKADQLANNHQLVNPYQDPFIYQHGLSEAALDTFMDGDGRNEPRTDLLVEVIDSLALKVFIREECRKRRIPVLMASDCGKIVLINFQDYRRNPDMRLGYSPDAALKNSLDEVMRSGQILDFIEFEEALSGPESVRDRGYMDWIHGRGEQPVTSIPQLGSTALLSGIAGAMIAAYALGHEIPEIVAIDTESYEMRIGRYPR